MAALSRSEAVLQLYEHTQLTPTSIVGTFQIIDKAGCSLILENVLTAAWVAYKVYETFVSPKLRDFRTIAPMAMEDLREREIGMLSLMQWAVPARSRTDVVDDLAYKLGVHNLDYGRAAVLSLVLPECTAMTDDQYARVVLCAAAQLERPTDLVWASSMATPAIGADYIISWAARIAGLSGPSGQEIASHQGTKRKREA